MDVLDPQQTQDALRRYGLDAPRGAGFAFSDPSQATFYDWHTHDYHQLTYAASGACQLETDQARILLPPQRAAWIPAGVRHRTSISEVSGVSLYFAPDAVAEPGDRVRILAASPLMREMAFFAQRWPLGAGDQDPVASAFFTALAHLCGEWLQAELPLGLARSGHPALKRAMDHALADLGACSLTSAVAAARMSERSFRRLFLAEVGMTWQAWLAQARAMAAMTRLGQGARVTDVAGELGFSSLSAFAKAFTRIAGENPTDYRRRARGESA